MLPLSVADGGQQGRRRPSAGASVSIGKQSEGFGLAVALEVVLPGVEHDEAQKLADAAHQVCPYTNAARGNIEVTISVSDD